MRILFTSDLHGLLTAYERFAYILWHYEYDVGVISGDLSTGLRPDELEKVQRQQPSRNIDTAKKSCSPYDTRPMGGDELLALAYKQKELQYKNILSTAAKPVLFIMGNDDGIIGYEWRSEGQLQNINQKRIDLGTYNFVGYQYTNPFVGGLFEKSEEEQMRDLRRLQRIIDGETILVTHGPAYGLYDTACSNPMTEDELSVGSKALRWLVDAAKPKIHLHGHIHRLYGIHGTSIG